MFCRRPFKEMYVDVNGDCHLCCPLWMSKKAGNVLHTPIVDIWNGTTAQDLRASILDRSFRYCTNCGNKRCKTDVVSSYDLREIDILTLGYDQACNLRCPSCRLSAKLTSPKAAQIHEAVWSSGILKMVRCLNFGGSGEPFASPLFLSFLKTLPFRECHPDLTLSLQTNGLLLTQDRLSEVLSSGKPLARLLVSVDAANADTYREVRGGDWNTLMANLVGLWTLLDRRQTSLKLNFVVQEFNFREISAFVELSALLGAQIVYFSVLENWGTYSEDDYLRRAIHEPTHPRHAELIEVLRDPRLRNHPDLMVDLTNLEALVPR